MSFLRSPPNDAYNLDHIIHIWVEKGVNGFFLMGEFASSGEEVVLSPTFIREDEATYYLSDILSLLRR